MSSQPARAGRRLAALLGLAALLVGVALLATAVGAFLVSKCGDTGEAQAGRLALAGRRRDRPPAPSPPRRAASSAWRRPVRIEIPSIGVRAPIIRLGLNPDRSLEVPTDFGDAGWWSGGPRPGEPGPAVIVGHVDSHTGPAVFYRLRELRPARHDRRRPPRRHPRALLRDRQRAIPEGRTSRPRASTARTAGPTLRLITCGGEFDRSSGHYLDNTVVYARAA